VCSLWCCRCWCRRAGDSNRRWRGGGHDGPQAVGFVQGPGVLRQAADRGTGEQGDGVRRTSSAARLPGCPAQGSKAKPTPVLTVKVGVETASKVGRLLATTTTTPSGTFTVTVTVPPVPSGGVPKLALVAQARDAATGLDYVGLAVLAYKTAAPPAPSTGHSAPPAPPAPSTGHSAPPAVSSAGGGVPAAVPAGSGGLAGSTTPTTRDAQLALGGTGLLLVAAGGVAAGRRCGASSR